MPRSAAAQNEEALFEGTDFMDQLGQRVTEFKMPPIVEFAESPEYLNLGRLYPRQKTILRLMFLETDNMTAYDLEVIEAWSKGFDQGPDRMGISPDIWDRIKLLKAEGYDHFREILAVIGRRGSKGHLGAITLARQMFWLLNAGPPLNDQGDVKRGYPQEAYGLSENKELVALVTATNFLQARDNQFADLYFTIRFAPCFQKSLAVDLPHFIALRTEGDLERIRRLQLSGGNSGGKIIASVQAKAVTSNASAGRGVASFAQAYDEFAHMLNGANGPRTSEEVYEALTPALDQFGKDALIYIPTSPYAKTGKAWEIYEAGLELDEDNRPVNPEILVLQLPSWEPYRDFDDDRATDGRVFAIAPQKFGPILQRLERRNPQKFRIERRSQWAEVLDAYLPKEFVDWMFMAFCEDCGIPRSTEDQLVCHECGDTKPPRQLYPQTRGTMQHRYRAWVDSAKSVHNMCMAVAHTEAIEEGDGKVWHHVIVDVIKIWKPEDFDDHTLPIDDIMDDMIDICQRFPQLDAISFDQHGALLVPLMRRLLKKMGHHARVKDVSWGTHNTSKTRSVQQRWEDFKTALSMRWVHSFRDNAFYDNTSSLVEEELRYLQEVNGKVRKQDVGPVITDDAADAVSAVATELLADQLSRFMKREALAEARIAPGARGGYSSGYLDPEDAGSSQARAALRRAVGGMSQGGNVRRRDAASALIARDMGGRRRQGRDPTRGRNR